LERTAGSAQSAPIGDLSALWRATPGLEELSLSGTYVSLGAIRAPRLRRLELGLWQADQAIASLARARAPLLERLEVAVLTFEPVNADALARLFATRGLPRLRHLAVTGISQLYGERSVDDLCRILAGSTLIERLETLSLSGDVLSPDATRALRDDKPWRKRLRGLMINGQPVSRPP
jgi:hypothetical protein